MHKLSKSFKICESFYLELVKEKLVRYWIDRVMQIGSTTTNKVEVSHNRLKKLMGIVLVAYVKIGLPLTTW